MEDDWGLQAVVRGCSSTSTTTSSSATTTTTTSTSTWSFSGHHQPPSQGEHKTNFFMGFSDLFQPRTSNNSIEDLLSTNLYKPTKLPFSPPPISPLSVLGGLQDLSPQQQQQQHKQPQQQQQQQYQQQFQQQQQLYLQKQPQPKQNFGGSRSAISQNPRSKKRKSQVKRVCQVPAEGLSSDMWSWRKYGQKPIKGSPYPRGYYRCSTSKGCMARKQVERNRTDPGMYILTYTGDHNHPMPTHRNSLAGSVRQKPTSSGEESSKPNCSPPVSPSEGNSPATEKREDMVEEEDDDDEEFVVSDVALEDDFFEGLEELVGSAAGECSSGPFPLSLPFSLVV